MHVLTDKDLAILWCKPVFFCLTFLSLILKNIFPKEKSAKQENKKNKSLLYFEILEEKNFSF